LIGVLLALDLANMGPFHTGLFVQKTLGETSSGTCDMVKYHCVGLDYTSRIVDTEIPHSVYVLAPVYSVVFSENKKSTFAEAYIKC